MLYVFVEGPDDSNFFKTVFSPLWGEYHPIEYSQMKKDKVNNFIKSIKSMPGTDYLFFSDEDGKGIIEKRVEVLTLYNELEPENLFIVQFEIESWYYAGVSRENCDKLKIQKYREDTNSLTKEQFYSFLLRPSEKEYVMAQMLLCFSKELAITRNDTFSSFYKQIKREPAAVC